MKHIHQISIVCKVGNLQLLTLDNFIISLLFENDNIYKELTRLEKRIGPLIIKKTNDNGLSIQLKEQLDKYFTKKLKYFELPLKLIGSDFDIKVWKQLQTIEYGQTISYIELANAIGCKSARAVGQAVGRNPIPIIIPCHRVIYKNGKLGGFSAGIEIKKRLFELEGVL